MSSENKIPQYEHPVHLTTIVYDEPFQEAKVAYLLAGNGVGFELFQFIDPKHRHSPEFGPEMFIRTGCFHIALTAADNLALADRLVRAGATKIGPVVQLAQGKTIQYVRDPNGLVLELCSVEFETLAAST